MAPPTYADLGKSARDLFSKNYRKTGMNVKLRPKTLEQRELFVIQENKSMTQTNVVFSLLPCNSYPSSCDNHSNTDLGLVKLDVKTKTPSGVDFNVNCVSNNDTGRFNSALETKYLLRDYGLTLREKWNTDNILTSEVVLEDKPLNGLKLSGNCSFAPQSGKKTGTVKAAFKTDALHVNTDVDLDYAGAIIHGAAVLGYLFYLSFLY